MVQATMISDTQFPQYKAFLKKKGTSGVEKKSAEVDKESPEFNMDDSEIKTLV